jgi:hypothetical protein
MLANPNQKQSKAKRGRPTKASPQLIEAVLADIAVGLTRGWACAAHGISDKTWSNWEKRKDFPMLRARTTGTRVKYLLGRLEKETNPGVARSIQWMLERTKAYENQFADPSGPKVVVGVTQNNQPVCLIGDQLEEARTRLDAVKERQRERGLRSAITDMRARGIKPEDDGSVAEQ